MNLIVYVSLRFPFSFTVNKILGQVVRNLIRRKKSSSVGSLQILVDFKQKFLEVLVMSMSGFR